MGAPAESQLFSIADYERAAAWRLDDRTRAYIDGGAGDEVTQTDTLSAWRRLAIRPRVLTGAHHPDLGVSLLGRRRAHPVLVAPTAFAAFTHPEAEAGIARAAAATATTMCLATLASISAAALADAVPAVSRWLQLYVFADRGVTREMVAVAGDRGYEALVVTADRPVIVKGVLTAQAAAGARAASCARDHGAAGVIVSNHGGRQLDTTLSGADARPEIADAVGDELDILVDGGIRHGTDVLKALALAGATSAAELDPSFVCAAPWARA